MEKKTYSEIVTQFWKENRFVVLDTETNGLTPGVNEPCEVAMLKCENGDVTDIQSWYLQTKLPIPPHVQAVHHISNETIAGHPSNEEKTQEWQDYCKNTIIIAHNASFDKSMMPALQDDSFVWADNLSLARHIWPLGSINPETGKTLTAHKCKIIQSWLDLEVDTRGEEAHRATADILVTMEIFRIAVNKWLESKDYCPTGKELVDFCESPCLIEKMPFKPHKGVKIKDLPSEYIRKMLKQDEDAQDSGNPDAFRLGKDLAYSLQVEYTMRTTRDRDEMMRLRQIQKKALPNMSLVKIDHLLSNSANYLQSSSEPVVFNTELLKGAAFNNVKDLKLAQTEIACVDIATTGYDIHEDRAVEVSIRIIKGDETIDKRTWRVNPQRPVTPGASALHGIFDRDLVAEKTIEELAPEIKKFVGKRPCMMYNMNYTAPLDYTFVPALKNNTWLCCARMAKHLWPMDSVNEKGFALESHDLWSVAYWKGLKTDEQGQSVDTNMQCAVMSQIFAQGIQDKKIKDMTIGDFFSFTNEPLIYKRMTFGAQKGKNIDEIPEKAFSYIMRSMKNGEIIDPDMIHTLEEQNRKRTEHMSLLIDMERIEKAKKSRAPGSRPVFT